jgi:hypothetical protein
MRTNPRPIRRQVLEQIGAMLVFLGCIGAIIGLGAIAQAILDGY